MKRFYILAANICVSVSVFLLPWVQTGIARNLMQFTLWMNVPLLLLTVIAFLALLCCDDLPAAALEVQEHYPQWLRRTLAAAPILSLIAAGWFWSAILCIATFAASEILISFKKHLHARATAN